MKNKKITKILSIILIICLNIGITNAAQFTIVPELNNDLTWGNAFNYYADIIDENIPESYKYIKLNFKGINEESDVYKSIQKLVYFDLIKNSTTTIKKDKIIRAYDFYKIIEKIFDLNIINSIDINNLKERKANNGDLLLANEIINQKKINLDGFLEKNNTLGFKKQIFNDVYSTILNEHYDKDNINEIDIIDGAIEGLANGTKDKHTVYFPPTETKNFYESLNGEYEGIGSYVEMEKPGVLKIVTPIKDSPSEKAGLKGADLILKVDGVEILTTTSLQEAVSWIKGPSGTTVKLTIQRGEEIFDVDVVREKIIIKDIEYEKFNSNTFYIEIKSFGDSVSKNFGKAIEELSKDKNINKIIIDLRSNGGGYLEEVSDMLSYFIAKGDNTAVVKYLNGEKEFKSDGYNLVDFSKYKIVILENSGTASASEIMIGTIKDYYPNTTIVGENSYGKGSVQTVKSYADGSTFKYTIAKWFTGKTKTGIDGIGIKPDIEIELDIDQFNKNKIDNQLEKAKEIR